MDHPSNADVDRQSLRCSKRGSLPMGRRMHPSRISLFCRRIHAFPFVKSAIYSKPYRSRKIGGALKAILLWWIVFLVNTSLREVLSFQSLQTRYSSSWQQNPYSLKHSKFYSISANGPSSKRLKTSSKATIPGLEHLQQNDNSTTNAYCFRQEKLSIQSFNMDLRGIASSDPRRANNILDAMENLYKMDQSNGSLVEPNSVSYTTVIEGWYLHKAQENDDQGDENNSSEDSRTKINTRDIDAISIEKETEICNTTLAAASAAQALLDRMEISDRLVPSASTYLLVCQKWAELNSPIDTAGENMNMAQAVLESYARKFSNGSNGDDNHHQERTSSSSNILSKLYTIVVEGWCRQIGKAPQAMERVEALLEKMEELTYKERRRQEENWDEHTETNENSHEKSWFHRRRGFIGPNSVTYSSVIVAISQSQRHNMARKADAMIGRMKNIGVEPDMVVYTSVLNCWAKAKSRKERQMASNRALEILRVMEESYITDKNYAMKPSVITYTTVIKAIGYSLDNRAPELAERVMRRMYNFTESGTLDVRPNVATYNAVITALSTSQFRIGQIGANARKAESLLVEMIRRSRDGENSVEPTVVTWGSVLRAYSLSGLPDSGEQAQRIVDMLETWYAEGKTLVRPNVICYTTVMSAWARGKAPARIALQKVNETLTKLEALYEETLDESLRPNKITYITAMDVYCRKCPDIAGSMSQNLVDHMMELYSKNIGYDRPTRIVFNTLINAWSRSQEPESAEMAEKIFSWLESQYSAGDEYARPDEVTLCAVLNAWANNAIDGGAMRAQQIMDHTETLTVEERGFDRTIVPWNILIKAWGRSKTADSVQRAEDILIHLEEEYKGGKSKVKPDITTYSSVINCCAYYTGPAKGGEAAFEVGWRTFQKIKKSDDLVVNNIVYGTLFKAIGKLTSRGPEQDVMIQNLFLECCQAGQVCNFVLSQVRSSSPPELFRSLVPKYIHDRDARNIEKILKKMPRKWSKNVV
mmetsp:Transcript_2580/g.6188  ORF Transcript_2580/g.6188 Transcript_2580/m.6188 type:complete len:989 (+) Transcript_2580:124-3090(+)|eukprot:CAMPEP_0116077492 /NCGR_PEP_ID=MMETSP0327-20121206/93_1 /TAXON_ID=44447 /ORGANISM="Pseudo-nitzschia delicatissima, Strain B596" /LENGTH=988 /DNA_ID=CAMNT_0003567965 /DNA_START=112 /DNA_END=3078 /DNA_ORIENTATION=-